MSVFPVSGSFLSPQHNFQDLTHSRVLRDVCELSKHQTYGCDFQEHQISLKVRFHLQHRGSHIGLILGPVPPALPLLSSSGAPSSPPSFKEQALCFWFREAGFTLSLLSDPCCLCRHFGMFFQGPLLTNHFLSVGFGSPVRLHVL